MKKSTILIIAGIILVPGLIILILGVVTSNSEIRMRNQVSAQQGVYESNFDKMFKVIAQVAQIPKAAEETFNKIYPDLIKGRYSNERGGALMSWITENNPQFDFSLYKDLSNAIQANRQEFFNEGRKLQDMQREHKNMIRTWPGSWFVGGRDTIAITIITSDKTEEAFKTGKDNDIELYPKPKATPK